ncbi:hypothetical protein MP638_001870 [Amoeboaphelidium occidentale]|nr:hypothetical protein MP638_001870 [Amoeboaphelidium occidentale]
MSKRNNGTGSITKDQFSQILQKHIKLWNGGSLFMERLFDAFDADGSKSIEVDEFIRGLSVFSKGTPEEKLELSFKIYDVNRDGHVTMNEINRVLTQLYSTFYPDDQTHQIKEITRRLFEDLDVDGDGELSLEEYKLSALKEPMIVNFLEQFMLESDL